MIRPWVALAASIALGTSVSPAEACTCGVVFQPIGNEVWASGYERSPEPEDIVAGGTFVIRMDSMWGDPVLLRDGEPVNFETERLPSDESCSGDFVAITPLGDFEEGDRLVVTSPEIADAYAFSEYDLASFDVTWGAPRAKVPAHLQLMVTWEPGWPHELSETLCPDPVSAPYQSFGQATVYVSSSQAIELYASVTATLPGGETYQVSASSHHRYDYTEERSLGGVDLVATVPLTASDTEPECIHVTLNDHALTSIFDETLCPEADGPALSARRDVDAALQELPPDPRVHSPRETSRGCSHAPRIRGSLGAEDRAIFAVFILVGGAWLGRRQPPKRV